jgi:crotonobetainyl-CoA:carnitine CoA-transferase CaiB-like acyl-CoA transferase
VTGPDGQPTDLSAYFMAANRNKLSVAVDIATTEGQEIIRQLAMQADVVIENFKAGGLNKYGLDFETMLKARPDLVYCSISGFGQTGPNASKPGYDLMAQGFGGLMSLTGDPEGVPTKVGVGIADVMCGMYATVGILAALRHKDRTGEGQHIDLALVDAQIAWLINEGVAHLQTGELPKRRGNQHPSIVPYQTFATSDGHILVAVGNDSQFERFCEFLGRPDLSENPLYSSNPARLKNRDTLLPIIEAEMCKHKMADVSDGLEARKVPVGPVHTLDQVFASEQVAARDMAVDVPSDDAASGHVRLLGNPLKFSKTPVRYRRAPPRFGQDTRDVLESLKKGD